MQATRISYTTGEATVNRTVTTGQVGGTSLGIMWTAGNGDVLSMFGTTYKDNIPPLGAGTDKRFNVVARIKNQDYQSRGAIISSWVTDRAGHAKLCLGLAAGTTDVACTPTSGIAVDGRQYVSYMNIASYGAEGVWRSSSAGFAYSDDYGTSWTKDNNARYSNFSDGSQRFQQIAFALPGDGYLYLYGTPNGRSGPARVARVPRNNLLDLSQHRQWNGSAWVNDQTQAVAVIPGPVSELSISFHEASHQWLAAYYHVNLDAIVVLTAPTVMGPWSAPNVVATAIDYPGLYGFFFHPWSMYDDTPCASMSQNPPYETSLMRLTGVPGTTNAPVAASSQFNSAQGYANVFNSVSNPNWCGSNNIFPVRLTDGRKIWISGLAYSGNLTSARKRPTNYQNVMNTVLEESQQMITAWSPTFFDTVGRAHFFDSRQIKDISGGVARLDPVGGISLRESLYLSVSWAKQSWTTPYLYDTGDKINGSSIILLEIPLETLKSSMCQIRKSVVMPSLAIIGQGTLNYGSGFYVFDKIYLHIIGRSSLTGGKWNIYLARVPLIYVQDVQYVPAAMEYFSLGDAGMGFSWSPDISQSTPILSEVGPNIDIRYDVSRKYAYLNKNPLTGTVDYRTQQSIARGTIGSTSSRSLFTVPVDQGSASGGFISPCVYDVPWAELASGNRLGAYTVQQFDQTFDQNTPSFSRPHFFEYDEYIGTPATPVYTAPPSAPVVPPPPPIVPPAPPVVPPPIVIPPDPVGSCVYVTGLFRFTTTQPTGAAYLNTALFPVTAGDLLVLHSGTWDSSCYVKNVLSISQNGDYSTGVNWVRQVATSKSGNCSASLYTATVPRDQIIYLAVYYQNDIGYSATCGYSTQRWKNTKVTTNTLDASNVSSAQVSFTTTKPKAVISYICADYNGRTGNAVVVGSGVETANTVVSPYMGNHYCYQTTSAVGTRAIGLSSPTGQLATFAAIELAPIA